MTIAGTCCGAAPWSSCSPAWARRPPWRSARPARPSQMLGGCLALMDYAGVTIAAIETGTAAVLLLGFGIAGLGPACSPAPTGPWWLWLPADDRAGLVAAIFTVSYLSTGLPALIAGITHHTVRPAHHRAGLLGGGHRARRCRCPAPFHSPARFRYPPTHSPAAAPSGSAARPVHRAQVSGSPAQGSAASEGDQVMTGNSAPATRRSGCSTGHARDQRSCCDSTALADPASPDHANRARPCHPGSPETATVPTDGDPLSIKRSAGDCRLATGRLASHPSSAGLSRAGGMSWHRCRARRRALARHG